MARRPSQVRKRRRSRQLMVEGLEGRQLLAANVAVAADAGAASSPLVRLVDAETGAQRASVMAFEATFKGGVRLAMGNVTGNTTADVVAGSGSGRVAEVKVFKVTSGGTALTEVLSFQPFGASYRGGVEVAVGDVDGDKVEDIIVAKSRDGGDVQVFRVTNSGGRPVATLYATIAKPFGADYNGGSSVGVADVGEFTNGALVKSVGDNKVEIVVGSGAGIPAQVRVYDISRPGAPRLADTIAPFGPLFQGGVSVTSGRYAASGVADSIDDIVVSSGRGGAALTRVFDGTVGAAANTILKTFTPYSTSERPNAAVFAAPVDVNGNGQVDRFLVTQGDPGGPAGIAKVSIAGTRSATAITGLAGPLRIAAARTVFQPQTVNGTVATPSPTAGVTAGSSRPMQIRDIVTGSGATANVGNTLTVQYTGMLTNGTVFDSSRQAGRTPFQLTLGAGGVIQGWEAGLVGMKVGGRRLLVIPPELAYGDTARTGIPAKSALVFDVELVSVSGNTTASIAGTSTGAVTAGAATTTAEGTLTVTDPDAGQAEFATPGTLDKTYGTFAFNASTGVWRYTLDNSRAVTRALAAGQTVTDSLTVTSKDTTASKTITVTITGAYDAPTNIALSAATVAENAAVGTTVGTFSTTDVDPGDTFTYALVSGTGDTDNASFAIAGATLKTAASFNFEAKSSYSIRVRSTDAGGLFTEKVFTITVTGVNEAPTDITLSSTTVSESTAVGTTVGTLSTTDADAGDTFTYALVSGTGDTDNASFSIVGAALKTAATFNFETQSSYSVRVRSTDSGGLTIEKVFTITVSGVNEAPTDIALSAATVAENAPSGTTVGTLSTTDVDAGDTFTYTLVSGTGSTDNASFTIAGATLKTAASFNFEAQSSYSIRVRSTDAGGLFTEKVFTITVTDVGENATIAGATTGAVSVDDAVPVASGTLTVTDPDAGQSVFAAPTSLEGTYGAFTFDPATGDWTYTLDTNRFVTWTLTADRPVTDSLSVTSVDGTASQSIDVTITGYAMSTLAATVPTPSPSATVEAGSTTSLQYRDATVGTGAVAELGTRLTVNYIGYYTDGTVFDSSLIPGREPFQFLLGAGEVIAGWDAGVEGMQVGGVRVLLIPPELGYGDVDLVFVVSLLDVTPA